MSDSHNDSVCIVKQLKVESDEPPSRNSHIFDNWISRVGTCTQKIICGNRLRDMPCSDSRLHRKRSGLLCYKQILPLGKINA